MPTKLRVYLTTFIDQLTVTNTLRIMTVLILAGISAFFTKNKSNVNKWIL